MFTGGTIWLLTLISSLCPATARSWETNSGAGLRSHHEIHEGGEQRSEPGMDCNRFRPEGFLLVFFGGFSRAPKTGGPLVSGPDTRSVAKICWRKVAGG